MIRDAANRRGMPIFIDARTDLFLQGQGDPATLMADALDRANAYAAAGASTFYVPGCEPKHRSAGCPKALHFRSTSW